MGLFYLTDFFGGIGGGKGENVNILITGGTGSLGKALTKDLLEHTDVRKISIYSRDEDKHKVMAREFNTERVRHLIGDVRDLKRLKRGMTGIDYVFHCAALKDVPMGEYNPDELKKTNIDGALNIIEAAGEKKVKKVIAISTDKAVEALNAYGKSKAFADSLFINANALYPETIFSLVRYGNVAGSRGSVIPLFRELLEKGDRHTVLPITDKRMTRFWVEMGEAVRLCRVCWKYMQGGEIFISQVPSFKITELVYAMSSYGDWEEIGIRAGEKIHEVMITEYDHCYKVMLDGFSFFILYPAKFWRIYHVMGEKMPHDFRYASNTNDRWLGRKELEERLKCV